MRSIFKDMFGNKVPGIRIDQTIEGSGNALRPDLYFPNLAGKRVIFDVGSASKRDGISKYKEMADLLFALIPDQWLR